MDEKGFARSAIRVALCSVALHVLAGCAALPTAGPVGSSIKHASKKGPFALVEVDSFDKVPASTPEPTFDPLPPAPQDHFDLIAPGDVVGINLYEIGVRLFSGTGGMSANGQFDPSARSERISGISVDPAGYIRIPYIGQLQAGGKTPQQLGEELERRLAGKSQYPQVLVTLDAALGSAVLIGGEVSSPGRIRLTAAREKLLDIITLAGGYRGNPADISVKIERNGVATSGQLDTLSTANIGGMTMEPGDRVTLTRQPRTFSVLGSINKVSQYPFSTGHVSLAEGLAMAGGANENTSDPAAVFVFRFEDDLDTGKRASKPVIYHVNMMKPASIFFAQKFMMRDKDVIYVGGAAANQPSKLLQIVGQVFTPILLISQLSNNN